MKLSVLNPLDQSLIEEIPLHNESEIENILQTASLHYVQNTQGMKPHERIKILKEFHQILTNNSAKFIELACREGGKPIKDTEVEMTRALQGIELAISGIAELKGEQIPMELTSAGTGKIAWTQKEPIGVVVAISAFNHPINLIIHQVITAIAAGCPVIIKPSLETPLTCQKLIDALYQSGLKTPWAQIALCSDSLAEKLATDSRVSFLTFIGSHKVGWHLRSQVAPGTRVALEHGGVAPAILEADSQWQRALPSLIKAAFYHSGQVCVSLQKLYVHSSISELVVQELKNLTSELVTGDALSQQSDLGPMIHSKAFDRVDTWVIDALNEGAQLVEGASKLSESLYSPTILLNPSKQSKVSQEEIFGPVVCVYTYEEVEEVLNECQQSPYHFQASIYTQDIQRAFQISQKMNAHTLLINEHPAFRVDHMPFGGRDLSGLGTGGILHTMKDMSRDKLFILNTVE